MSIRCTLFLTLTIRLDTTAEFRHGTIIGVCAGFLQGMESEMLSLTGAYVDGVASWESAWPVAGATDEGNMTLDNSAIAGANAHGKGYMIGKQCLRSE